MTSNKITAVWIDHANVVIYRLLNNEIVCSKKAPSNVDFGRTNVLQTRDTFHHLQAEELKKFYAQIVTWLQDANNVLLMGPGTAKTDFLSYLKKKDILKAVNFITQDQDAISDNQIIQLAQKEMGWELKHLL